MVCTVPRWGARTLAVVATGLEFSLPTEQQRLEWEESGTRQAAQAGGDTKVGLSGDNSFIVLWQALMMILAAEAAVMAQMGPLIREQEEEEEPDPGVFKPSQAAMAALSEEEAAALAAGQVSIPLISAVVCTRTLHCPG